MSIIDKTNYHIASKGEFKPIPKRWTDAVVSTASIYKEFDNDAFGHQVGFGQVVSTGLPKTIKLGNHIWKQQYISCSGRYNSVSIYYINETEDYLLRISDHWSESNLSTKVCGNIVSCYWTLKGHTTQKSKCLSGHLVTGGIIAFSDLIER